MTPEYFDTSENMPKKERVLPQYLKMTVSIGIIAVGPFLFASYARASGFDQPRLDILGKATPSTQPQQRLLSQEGGLIKKIKADKKAKEIEEKKVAAYYDPLVSY